eukprot:m.6717 g.6717  ORF g.6717 m.6717 type:complete len:741 (-) comp4911_c0_seq1:37-2259(-)
MPCSYQLRHVIGQTSQDVFGESIAGEQKIDVHHWALVAAHLTFYDFFCLSMTCQALYYHLGWELPCYHFRNELLLHASSRISWNRTLRSSSSASSVIHDDITANRRRFLLYSWLGVVWDARSVDAEALVACTGFGQYVTMTCNLDSLQPIYGRCARLNIKASSPIFLSTEQQQQLQKFMAQATCKLDMRFVHTNFVFLHQTLAHLASNLQFIDATFTGETLLLLQTCLQTRHHLGLPPLKGLSMRTTVRHLSGIFHVETLEISSPSLLRISNLVEPDQAEESLLGSPREVNDVNLPFSQLFGGRPSRRCTSIEKICLSCEALTCIDGLLGIPCVTLSGCSALSNISALREAKSVWCYETGVTDLAPLANVEHVHVEFCHNAQNFASLAHVKRVELLDCNGIGETLHFSQATHVSIGRAHSLRRLQLPSSMVALTLSQLPCLADLPDIKVLEKVYLSMLPIQSIAKLRHVRDSISIYGCHQLQDLGCSLESTKYVLIRQCSQLGTTVAFADRLARVRHLDIDSASGISDVASRGLPPVQALSLSHVALNGYDHLANLTDLQLTLCALPEDISMLRKVRRLTIRACSSQDMACLKGLHDLVALEELYLQGIHLTGKQQLCRPCRSVSLIYCSGHICIDGVESVSIQGGAMNITSLTDAKQVVIRGDHCLYSQRNVSDMTLQVTRKLDLGILSGIYRLTLEACPVVASADKLCDVHTLRVRDCPNLVSSVSPYTVRCLVMMTR